MMRGGLSIKLPLLILVLWALLAAVAPYLPLQPDHIQLQHILAVPGEVAVLGYDDLGRSIADRMIVGARTSLLVDCAERRGERDVRFSRVFGRIGVARECASPAQPLLLLA